MDEEKRTPKKDKHVKWDEDKLKETQKTRGTFQKITEPKTPYRGNSDVHFNLCRKKTWKKSKKVNKKCKLMKV